MTGCTRNAATCTGFGTHLGRRLEHDETSTKHKRTCFVAAVEQSSQSEDPIPTQKAQTYSKEARPWKPNTCRILDLNLGKLKQSHKFFRTKLWDLKVSEMGRSCYRQSRKKIKLTVDHVISHTVWTEKATTRAKIEAMHHVISLQHVVGCQYGANEKKENDAALT